MKFQEYRVLTNDPPLENMVVRTHSAFVVGLFELQLLHYELGISDFMTIPSTLIPVDGFETWRAAVAIVVESLPYHW